MIDIHAQPSAHWGIRPVLFEAWGVPISSYAAFITLGVMAGLISLRLRTKKYGDTSGNNVPLILAALFGGILGAKVPIWIVYYREILNALPDLTLLLSGRTIVGGLIGGTIAVRIARQKLGFRERRGNLFAPSIALGISIGRLGCFFQGCCYGTETDLPWSVNLGDGLQRHPVQLYEACFCFILFCVLYRIPPTRFKQGLLFDGFMISYFTFRFFEEFIRTDHEIVYGLSFFQWVSIAVVLWFSARLCSIGRFGKL